MVHGWLPGGGLEKLVSICLGGLGVESKCLRQVALVDLSILNFGMMRGKGGGPSMAIGPRSTRSCSHDAVIRIQDEAGNVIETHEHAGEFREAPPFTPPRNRMKFSMRPFIACVAFNESGLPSGESSPNKHGSAGEYALRSRSFSFLEYPD
jgi:hypothetical protein